MRHRLLGIVIGSRATAVAIIFHYYCYRSVFPAMPSPPGLAFFLLLLPTDIVTTCGVLHRRIEITRVNLTFDLILECAYLHDCIQPMEWFVKKSCIDSISSELNANEIKSYFFITSCGFFLNVMLLFNQIFFYHILALITVICYSVYNIFVYKFIKFLFLLNLKDNLYCLRYMWRLRNDFLQW